MKKFVIVAALSVMAVAGAVPAEALNIHVGPRGVGVGVGHRGVARRGFRGRPFAHRRVVHKRVVIRR